MLQASNKQPIPVTIDRWADPWQLPRANSAIFTHDWKSADPHVAKLLARPILQEYDAPTVDEVAVNSANQFENLAAR